VISRPEQLFTYDCDAYTIEKSMPVAAGLPRTTEEVAELCRLAERHGLPIVPRGAGTGLSGGALPVQGGIIIALTRMTRILDIDVPNRTITAQAGAVNLNLTKAVEKDGFFFAPDPSSQGVATIGGNVAENAGGPHTLRDGVTTNHVTGLRMVLADGSVVSLGGKAREAHGYDLVGAVVGSEGTFGIVTEVTCRLTRSADATATLLATFASVDAATQAVTEIIAGGLLPVAMEFIDAPILEAVESAFGFGIGVGAAAALVIEFDGCAVAVDEAGALAERVCRANGATAVASAVDDEERARLWQARKKAVGALGHLAPSHVTHDGVIPRSKLPEVLRQTTEIAFRHGLRNANVFHAGDGNLHPILLIDDANPAHVSAVVAAGAEILDVCLRAGGSITGEHGVGIEKASLMSRMFDVDTIDAMWKLKACFDPSGRCNPGKVFPESVHRYAERVESRG
jgi:glycolate oxidase subunit GlcD